MGNSAARKIVIPKKIILKLCTRNYFGQIIHHINFGLNWYSGSFSSNRRNIISDFLHCNVLFLLFLDPVPRSNRPTDFQTFWLKGTTDMFRARRYLFWIKRLCDVIWGKYAHKSPKFGRE